MAVGLAGTAGEDRDGEDLDEVLFVEGTDKAGAGSVMALFAVVVGSCVSAVSDCIEEVESRGDEITLVTGGVGFGATLVTGGGGVTLVTGGREVEGTLVTGGGGVNLVTGGRGSVVTLVTGGGGFEVTFVTGGGGVTLVTGGRGSVVTLVTGGEVFEVSLVTGGGGFEVTLLTLDTDGEDLNVSQGRVAFWFGALEVMSAVV